jgi:hypothetical protein
MEESVENLESVVVAGEVGNRAGCGDRFMSEIDVLLMGLSARSVVVVPYAEQG